MLLAAFAVGVWFIKALELHPFKTPAASARCGRHPLVSFDEPLGGAERRGEAQFPQRPFDGSIGGQEGAGGWDFKVLGDGIAMNQTIRKGRAALPDFLEKPRPTRESVS